MALTQLGTDGIKDDAVTLAKRAGLTRGSVVIGDASGNPSNLTKGAAGKVLTSDGTDLSWGAVPAGGIGADAITGAKIADDALDSEHYTDGSIDHAHLAADCVDGDNIADDSIGSEHIADNAVGLAAMASGTDGTIITYDSSGNPVAVGPGSAHDILTSQGAGNPPVWSAPVDQMPDNSVTLAKMAGGTDGQIITYDASGDPVAVGPGTDGQVLTSTGAGSPPAFETISAGNTPAFLAGYSDQFSFSGDQWVKDTSMTSLYASNAAFDDSTNDRWTPGVAGKYYCWFSSTFFSGNGLYTYRIRISKNAEGYDSGYDGGEDFFAEGRPNVTGDDHPEYCLSIATIIDMDADDYIDAWLWHAGSGVTRSFHGHHFGAFKIA